jgi:PAS domain S-box-containing protein
MGDTERVPERSDGELVSDVATLSGLRQFTDQLLERIAAAVAAERATLSRVDGDWVVIEGSFDSNGPPAQAGSRWQITAPEFQRLVTQREPMVHAFDPATLPAPFREQLAGVKHSVTVPLIVEGKVFATVAVSRRQDRPFEPRDMETLRELGNIAVLALRHTMLLAQARVATSELRTSEERFHLLVDGVKDYAIFLMDPAGYVTSWNQGAERIKGYQAHEILGRHLSTFYPPDDVAAGKPAMGLIVAEQQGRFETEGWRIRKDGSRFWANVVITALRDEAGRLRGFAKITRDITEQKQIQDQLLEAERREAAKFREHADRMAILEETKSQFLQLASHELRTPVALICGYLSLFEQGDLGEVSARGKTALSVLATQGRELNRLVGEILEVARMDEGALTLQLDTLDFRELVAEAVETVRLAASGDHRLTLVTPDQAVPVSADRKRLSMVLHKLLDNAIKYSPDGGEIACDVLAVPGWAELDIRDHGLGLEPAQLDQLFRRFGRIVTDETADIRGSGLGLYLARETARLHGGDITVESEPGRGSTFTIRIPLADTPESLHGKAQEIANLERARLV